MRDIQAIINKLNAEGNIDVANALQGLLDYANLLEKRIRELENDK